MSGHRVNGIENQCLARAAQLPDGVLGAGGNNESGRSFIRMIKFINKRIAPFLGAIHRAARLPYFLFCPERMTIGMGNL